MRKLSFLPALLMVCCGLHAQIQVHTTDIFSNPPVSKSGIDTFSLNNILYADQFAGSDIGAKINAAYGALPPQGGTIMVAPQSAGGCYSFSTPIAFTTAGKYPLLESLAPGTGLVGGMCLNYTPTTDAAAITLDYVSRTESNPPKNHGLKNVTLVNNGCNATGGCGSSATGILVGMTNAGDFNATMDGVAIYGFGAGYVNGNVLSPGVTWSHFMFQANGSAIRLGTLAEFYTDGEFAGNGGVMQALRGTTPEVHFVSANMFGNFKPDIDFTQAASSSGYFDCANCHFENSPGTDSGYIEGNVNIYLNGGSMEDDNSTGTQAWFVSCSGYWLVVDGTQILSPRAYDQMFLLNAPCRARVSGVNLTPSTLSAVFGGGNAAHGTAMMTAGGTWNAADTWTLESPLTLPNLITTGAIASALCMDSGGHVISHAGSNCYLADGAPAPAADESVAATPSGPTVAAFATPSPDIGAFLNASSAVSGGALGHISYYATSTTAVSNDPRLDDGATQVDTLTYGAAGGIAAASYATTGSNGGLNGGEGTGAGLIAGYGHDLLYADSTKHCWRENLNNTDAGCTVTASNTVTMTNKTLTSPVLTDPVLGAASANSLLVNGIVDGRVPVTVTSSTAVEIGGGYKSGYTFNEDPDSDAPIVYNLPTAARGLQYCFSNAYSGSRPNTGTLQITTSAAGQYIIFTDGSLSASGGSIKSGGAARDSACVVGVDGTHWIAYVYSGVWTKN